jgi:hypothetical protein
LLHGVSLAGKGGPRPWGVTRTRRAAKQKLGMVGGGAHFDTAPADSRKAWWSEVERRAPPLPFPPPHLFKWRGGGYLGSHS